MAELNNRPIIGWEDETPVPNNYQFADYLVARDGRLFMDGLDLASLVLNDNPNLSRPVSSPLEIVYLPIIRYKIKQMKEIFAQVMAEIGYEGQFHYAYASKANAAEEVIRTTLQAGANHEMSSTVDVDIAQLMIQSGRLTPERLVVANGFKPAGSHYAANLLRLKQQHANLIPVIEDLGELATFIESDLPFEMGLRQKSYGPHNGETEMNEANSRFGLDLANLWKAASYIEAAPNLSLRLYHFMVGSQLTDSQEFVNRLRPGMEIYARLRQRHPSLSIFNFGGGMPVPMTLDFNFDYQAFVRLLLTTIQEVSGRYNIPVPDIMGEFGRYTTAEHGAHIFKIIAAKENNSPLPWYIIDGSIMSSFPDSWALAEHFIVLPLNHLDKPFQQVQLGGITCDSDDVYPPKPSRSPLYLPAESDNLYIGFFSIGAYQEMLGGVKGSKHCVLPEANELVIDHDSNGKHQLTILSGQQTQDILRNLGYTPT